MNNLFSKLFSGPVLVTLLRYALAAAGGWVVAKGFLPAEAWDEVAGAVLIVIGALTGAKATVTPKVVTKTGETVPMTKMPASEAAEVNAIANNILAGS